MISLQGISIISKPPDNHQYLHSLHYRSLISVSLTDLRVRGTFWEIASQTKLTCCGVGTEITSTEGLRSTSKSLTIDFHNNSSSGIFEVFCTSSFITLIKLFLVH